MTYSGADSILSSGQNTPAREHAQVLLGRGGGRRENIEESCLLFSLILKVFEKGFLQKITDFDRKELPIKAGRITEPDWIYRE